MADMLGTFILMLSLQSYHPAGQAMVSAEFGSFDMCKNAISQAQIMWPRAVGVCVPKNEAAE